MSATLFDRPATRARLREQRRALAPSLQQQHAQRVAQQLSKQCFFQQATHIACYLATDGELDTAPILEALWQADKQCYLPIQHPEIKRHILFCHHAPNSPLETNSLGIREPKFDENKIRLAWQLDLVLLPLIAFDTIGGRLGFGFGCYDRALAFCRQPQAHKPILIGLAHGFQQVEPIPAQPWDIPLDGVITETQCHLFHEEKKHAILADEI